MEFDIPLGFLPTVFPPGTRERERTSGLANGALMRTGEEGERVLVATSLFGGDVDGDGRTLALKWKVVEG